MINKKDWLAILPMTFCLASPSQAANLTAAGNFVYDSVSNLSWTTNGNLLATMESKDSQLIAKIISNETDTIFNTYGHTLVNGPSYYDFSSYTYGAASWWGTVAFVDYLNNIKYEGYNSWVLPSITDFSNLFLTDLAEQSGSSITTSHNSDYSLFTNVQGNFGYWTGTVVNSSVSDYFNTYKGWELNFNNIQPITVWVAVSGTVAASVPEPEIFSMFTLGLLGLGIAARKKT